MVTRGGVRGHPSIRVRVRVGIRVRNRVRVKLRVRELEMYEIREQISLGIEPGSIRILARRLGSLDQ